MKLFRNTKGFGAVEVVLILVVIGLIGGVGFYVWQVNNKEDELVSQDSNPSESVNTQETPQVPQNWQWFESKDKSIKFAYPKDWGSLTENVAEEYTSVYSASNQYDPSKFMAPITITKKTEFLTQVMQGFPDYTWYRWDEKTNSLVSAIDTQPPSDDALGTYTKPTQPGNSVPLESILTSSGGKTIYKIMGHGALHCGTYHYFFDIKDKVVHLAAALCGRGGASYPENSAWEDIDTVESSIMDFHKYFGS